VEAVNSLTVIGGIPIIPIEPEQQITWTIKKFKTQLGTEN
jgi:hypothetical protein